MKKTKKKKLVKVVISRSNWSRGKQIGDNLLLVTKKAEKEATPPKEMIEYETAVLGPVIKAGTMCCLGFACLAVGATKKQIAGKAMPGKIKKLLPGLNKEDGDCYGYKSTDFSSKASNINDSKTIREKTREKRLKNLAKKNGFQFIFTK